MSDFEKQVNELIQKQRQKIESDYKRLCELAQNLGINKDNIADALEFAELFSRLKDEGIIVRMKDI